MYIYGLALIKNGEKFDFPYRESLQSLAPLVNKTFINVGIGEDGTLDLLKKSQDELKLEIIEVEWNDRRSDHGHILSDNTNIPLEILREKTKDKDHFNEAWVIYLQSDEVIHERDLELIKEDLKKADESGCDAMRFRYLHFWKKHNSLAIGPRWYPQEIRAIKLNSKAISHGDAQTFSGWTKAYESDAHIYHYGHVREDEAYTKKMKQMSRYYHSGFDLFRKRLKTKIKLFFKKAPIADFYGDHPMVMKERIARLGGDYIRPEVELVSLQVKNKEDFPASLLERINAKKVVFNERQGIQVSLKGVEKSLRSPIARPWTDEFRWTMALSAQGVGLKK